jgi:hypothetical protein
MEYTKLIEKTENSRVAKINGIFEVVEILQGYGSDGAKIQRENSEITELNGDAYLKTVGMHNEKMAYRAAHSVQSVRQSVTDKTLVVDPDMVGTY